MLGLNIFKQNLSLTQKINNLRITNVNGYQKLAKSVCHLAPSKRLINR